MQQAWEIARTCPPHSFNDFSSSYEFLCERANTLPLSFHRLRFSGIEMYKCIKETNPIYLNDLFCEQTNVSDYQLRDSSRLIQPKFNFGANLWNVLPVDIKQSESLSIFETGITKWCYSDAAKAGRENVLIASLHYFYYTFKVMSFVWQFILGFSELSACFLPLL